MSCHFSLVIIVQYKAATCPSQSTRTLSEEMLKITWWALCGKTAHAGCISLWWSPRVLEKCHPNDPSCLNWLSHPSYAGYVLVLSRCAEWETSVAPTNAEKSSYRKVITVERTCLLEFSKQQIDCIRRAFLRNVTLLSGLPEAGQQAQRSAQRWGSEDSSDALWAHLRVPLCYCTII